MRTANPPLYVGRRPLTLRLPYVGPRQALVAANALSLSRGVLALAIFGMSLAGASIVAILAIACAMWLTDTLDGMVARGAVGRDATAARVDGAALDPLMDDVAFIAGFLILLDANAVPLWFVGALLPCRVLFALIRVAGLAHHEEEFAKALPITKISGTTLAIGQLMLMAHVAFPATLFGHEAVAVAAIVAMTVTTAISVTYFAVRRHGRTLARLLTIPEPGERR